MFKFSDLLFPEDYTCLVCGNDVFNNPYNICEGCYKNLPHITGKVCLHCSDPLISDGNYCKRCKGKHFYFDKAVAPFFYKNEIVDLIYNFKYNGKKYIAKSLAKIMAEYFCKQNLNIDIVIPVPLHQNRLKHRGFNQSEILAEHIAKHLNIKVDITCLQRVIETPTQTNLNFIERQKNLANAFKVYKPKKLKDKSVLLIDDVYTTGATITECAKVLKKAGVKCVYVLTLAHTLLENKKDKDEEYE